MALTGLTKVTNIGINTTTIPTLGGSRNTGVVTATTFVGDGSGLSNVTGSGSGVIVRDGGSLVGTAGTINFGTNLNVSAISAGIVTVTNAVSASALTNLSDVTVTSASNGQILKHNGSVFVNVAETDTTYSQSSVASGSNVNLRLTDSGGTNDDILITAGSNITFSSVTANGFTIAASGGGGGGGLSNVVEDTTPQLGGSLDLNNKFITGSGGINVSGVVTATSFVGNITGNVTGNADTATNSTNSSHVLVTDNESTNENNLIPFVENATSTTGNVGLEMDGDLTYNPSSGNLTATKFTGSGVALTGVVTSIVAGSNITLTGGPTGIVTIAAAGGGSGITDVIQDTTPQLGGNLDLNSKYITGSGGINVTGVITATTFVGNGDFVDLDVDGHTELDNVNIAGVSTFNDHIVVKDDKEIRLGDTNDFRIFHDNTNTLNIINAQSGNFRLQQAGATFLQGLGTGVKAYFGGNEKLATTSGGVDITGIATATGFSGPLTGNVTGAATRVTLTNQAGDTTCNVLFAQSATGNQLPHTNANLTFNATSGALTAGSFVKSGGSSSQFLKADGSVDSNTYLTSGSYLENVSEDSSPQLGGDLDLNSKNITGTGNAQIVGVITATSAVKTWTLGASGTDHYTFIGDGFTSATNDPDIYLERGHRYAFLQNAGTNHPFWIKTTPGTGTGNAYNTGVTNNGAQSGYVTFNVPWDAPSHLYYQCQAHGNMVGNIYIRGGNGSYGGKLLVGGQTSQRSAWFNQSNTFKPSVQVEGSGEPGGQYLSITANNNASGYGARFLIGRTRGTTAGATTVVNNGDELGGVSWFGSDGSEMVEAAHILSYVDAGTGSNTVPGSLRFGTTANGAGSPTEALRIDSSGRVQIGSSTLAARNTFNGIGRLNIQNNSADGTVDFTQGIVFTDNASNEGAWTHAAIVTTGSTGYDGNLVFGTDGSDARDMSSSSITEKMRLTADGRLLVGRTNAITISSDPGDACFEQLSNNGMPLTLHCNQNDQRGLGIYYTTGKNPSDAIRYVVGSSAKFLVLGNGNCQNANNIYTSISDATLKENIVDANSQWNDIKNIKIRNFNFTEASGYETHTQIGCVAQEVETVSPKLVDSSGKDGIKTVASSVLYMKAVKALQESMARIETLEAKVAALEGS